MNSTYPNEFLTVNKCSLTGFVREAHRLEGNAEAEDEQGLLPDLEDSTWNMSEYVLTGRSHVGGNDEAEDEEQLVFLKAPQAYPRTEEQQSIKRTYGRRWGYTGNLPFACPFHVFPLGLSGRRIGEHVTVDVGIEQHERGNYDHVPVRKIPHVLLAQCPEKGLFTWLAFPALYYPGCSTTVYEHDCALLYNACIRPSLADHTNNLDAKWAPTFERIYQNTTRQWKRLISSTVLVEANTVAAFGTSLMGRVALHDEFSGAIFVHEIQEQDQTFAHDPRDEPPLGEERAWDDLTSIFSVPRRRLPELFETWYGEVSLQFTQQGKVVLWTEEGMAEFLHDAFSGISQDVVTKALGEALKTRTCGVTEWCPRALTVGQEHTEEDLRLRRVTFTASDGDLLRGKQGCRTYSTRDMMPEYIEETLTDLQALQDELYSATLTIGENKEYGAATVTFEMGLSSAKNALLDFAEPETCLRSVGARAWWQTVYWRLVAVTRAVETTIVTPVAFREKYKSALVLTPIIVHLLNCLTVPVPLEESLRDLLEASAYAHVTGVTTAQEWEVAVAAGRQRPALAIRGLYFLAGIVEQNLGGGCKVWRVAGLDRECYEDVVDEEALLKLFNVESYSHLRQQLLLGSTHTKIRNPRREEIKSGRSSRRTLIACYIRRRPTEQVVAFQLNEHGVRLQPTYRLQGRDMEMEGENIPLHDLIDPDDMNKTVNFILVQFCHDLLEKFPSRRGRSAPPYITMTERQRAWIPREAFLQAVIPSDCAYVRLLDVPDWNAIIGFLFPRKGYTPPEKTVGYPSCTYYLAWVKLLNHLTAEHATLVVEAVHRELNNWHWLPWARARSMWGTGPRPYKKVYVALPSNHLVSAPVVVANPFIYLRHNLNRFRLG